ncbi:putative ribonuclease H-like domain-containing protein [Tanacetum coccineum]
MVPRTVLTRFGPISVNAARPVNTDQSRTTVNNARPMKNVINNAYSTARRPFNKIVAANNNNFTKKVNIVKGTRVNTARPKAVISPVMGNKGNVVKASACWVWRPKHKVLDHGNPQQDLKDKGVIDSGCSRHMTGNRSYLTNYEEINGGFIAFGGNSKGGKITGKGKLRTGKLDFKDVYFVKKLKFNLFSVLQMCEKKNSVLFTDTACIVLSPDFKLTDESHVLLKVPRKDNMYSFDLKNVVPQGGRKPALSFMRPFGCPVTILNTIDHLGKFDGKADEGFFVRYSTNSKAFRVFNSRTRSIEKEPACTKAYDDAVQRILLMLDSNHQGVEMKDDEDLGIKSALQMDVKSAFLYGKIKEEDYVCQPPGFENPDFPDRVYKVEKALYGLHQAPRAWTASEAEGRWDFYKSRQDGKDVDEHLYRSMIGSLMYLTSSRPDIMFATKIHIDNESTICIVKNLVFHSKTKHIEIRHHFIRDSNEKKLIQMIKIHTDQNVAYLLTKAFDNEKAAKDEIGKKQSRRKQRKDNEDPQLSGPTKPVTNDTENVESIPTHSNDPLLSGEDRLKLNELMELVPAYHK